MKCPECDKIFPTESEMLEHYHQNHESQVNVPERQLNKRPDGITVLSILLLLFGLFNLYSAYQTSMTDIDSLQYLNGRGVSQWFNIGVPAELGLSIITIGIGFIQLITAYGLLKGKQFAYLFTLTALSAILVVNVASLLLYLSAPSGIGISVNYGFLGGSIGGGIVWTLLIWKYLSRPYVKAFLGIT